MWQVKICFSLLRVTIFVCLGSLLVVILNTTTLSSPKTRLFKHDEPPFLSHHEESFLPSHSKDHFFERAIQRLLRTHAMFYNESTSICEQREISDPKEKQILNDVAQLLPRLRSEIVPYPHEYYTGRGIVLTVGPNQLLHTRFNLRIIEWSRTKLPVEVWYSSAQISRNITNELLSSVPTLEVKACCFETLQCHYSNGEEINLKKTYVYVPQTENFHRQIFSFKPAAILSSTFAEVLFLDSDCYVVRDPISLFTQDPMYMKFGVLFYPDIYMSHQHPQVWLLLNTSCVHEFSLDSGTLLFNKKRVWNGLYLAKLMSDHHEIFYKKYISDGDKDTFRLAFRYLKIPYYTVGIPCSTGYVENTSFCGVTLCKTDSLGLNVYFDHVHHPKVLTDRTFGKEKFTHTRVALADPNNQTYLFGYCGLYPPPCFQVGFWAPMSLNTYCTTSALDHTERPLEKISPYQSALWNPNVERKLLLMKKTEETMLGYVDFYFQTYSEPMFRNAKL